MSFSNFLEQELLDHVFAGAAYTPPTNIYVKLHLGDPGEDGTANPAAETDRQTASFGVAAAGSIVTDTDIDWLSVAASETYSHVSLWDAATAGNCLGSGALTASVVVTAGDNFKIPAGDLSVTLD